MFDLCYTVFRWNESHCGEALCTKHAACLPGFISVFVGFKGRRGVWWWWWGVKAPYCLKRAKK